MIKCENIKKTFYLRKNIFSGIDKIEALKGVTLEINENEIVGLVGESGSGKSTLGRILLLLTKADEGKVLYKGKDITNKTGNAILQFRKEVQAVFQDPFSSLNPKLRIIDTLKEPFKIHTSLCDKDIISRISETLEMVGINPEQMYKYPHEFSGGQRQRINIARAILLKPSLIIADEPISSLDVSIQAQIINLFLELQSIQKFSILFISHDLRVIRHISDRIAVVNNGEIVDMGTTKQIFEKPEHHYTRMLINSMPEKIIFI